MRTLFGLLAIFLVPTVIIPTLFELFNFGSIMIPYSIYSFIHDGLLYFFDIISPFVPLSFIVTCLFLIFTIKHANILINLVKFIIKELTSI